MAIRHWPPELSIRDLRFEEPETRGKSKCFWFRVVATGELALVKLPDWHARSCSYRLSEMGSELAGFMLGRALSFPVAKLYRVTLSEEQLAAQYEEFQRHGSGLLHCIGSVDVGRGTRILAADDYLAPRVDAQQLEHPLTPAQYLHLLGKRRFSQLIRLSIWDAFIGNEDRHLRNWALLATRYAGVTKYFDQGSAFFGLLDNGAYKYPVEVWYLAQEGRLDRFIGAKTAELVSAIFARGRRSRYTHDQLMEFLASQYGPLWQAEARRYYPRFRRLTDELIDEAMGYLEGTYWRAERVKYVARYLKLRRDRMLEWLQDNGHD